MGMPLNLIDMGETILQATVRRFILIIWASRRLAEKPILLHSQMFHNDGDETCLQQSRLIAFIRVHLRCIPGIFTCLPGKPSCSFKGFSGTPVHSSQSCAYLCTSHQRSQKIGQLFPCLGQVKGWRLAAPRSSLIEDARQEMPVLVRLPLAQQISNASLHLPLDLHYR